MLADHFVAIFTVLMSFCESYSGRLDRAGIYMNLLYSFCFFNCSVPFMFSLGNHTCFGVRPASWHIVSTLDAK